MPDLLSYRGSEMDLDALAAAAHRLLRQARLRIDDGRVAGAPDARGIRYYQTLGVIDRPLRYDGRRAIYGYRHLLQLLAIRQLQREGYPLAVIQATLPARTTDALEQSLVQALAPQAAARAAAAPVAADETTPVGPATTEPAALPQAPRRILTGEVAPGITLSIDPGRVADADERFARIAAHLARFLQED
jgi:DNA-binding transcriptional MerR regulator